jgi:hypothetical protein
MEGGSSVAERYRITPWDGVVIFSLIAVVAYGVCYLAIVIADYAFGPLVPEGYVDLGLALQWLMICGVFLIIFGGAVVQHQPWRLGRRTYGRKL